MARLATLRGPQGNVAAGHLYRFRRRRRSAQDVRLFASLIASPFDLGTAAAGNPLPNALTLPANGFLGISEDAAPSAGDLSVDIGARSVGIAGGLADQIFRLGYAERAESVSVDLGGSAPSGTVALYVFDEWFRPFVIATGTVS